GTVCVVGKIRDLILQLSKSSIYSTKPTLLPVSVMLQVVALTVAVNSTLISVANTEGDNNIPISITILCGVVFII
ncbi:hypothetical protein BMT66_25790, partial [Escherichia coli]